MNDLVERLRQTLPGIAQQECGGDNLAILLASYFETGIESEKLDDSGTWKQGAIDASDKVLDAIHAHYATALEAKDREIEALRASYDRAVASRLEWRHRAETAERELDALSSSHRDLAKRLAAMGRERDQARAALKLLTPGHRAPGCWCSYGRDIDRSDHEIGCRAARAIMED